MDNFLQKLKLSDELTTELDISRSDFIIAFERSVDSLYYNPSKIFSSSKNTFEGHINQNGFVIKKRYKFSKRDFSGLKGVGTFAENNGKLVIHTKINGTSSFIGLFTIIASCYFFAITSILLGNIHDEPFYVILFILAHGIFMIAGIYYTMRRSVSNLKDDLEFEFKYGIIPDAVLELKK